MEARTLRNSSANARSEPASLGANTGVDKARRGPRDGTTQRKPATTQQDAGVTQLSGSSAVAHRGSKGGQPDDAGLVIDPPPSLAADPEHRDSVLLSLPANSAYLSVLRTATAGLAARLQFTLDEIEDLRIAVDEACAMLLASEPVPDSKLSCHFALDADRIVVTVSVLSTNPAPPSPDTFAWQVLTALAGAVKASVTDGRLTIQLTKRRGRNQ